MQIQESVKDKNFAERVRGGDKIFAESIVLEIKQISGNDHYFYRRDLQVATNWLTEAIAKHGRNDLDAIIEELKFLCATDHYMYRMRKAAAVKLLHQAMESAESKLKKTFPRCTGVKIIKVNHFSLVINLLVLKMVMFLKWIRTDWGTI